jgi:hypothetical protein
MPVATQGTDEEEAVMTESSVARPSRRTAPAAFVPLLMAAALLLPALPVAAQDPDRLRILTVDTDLLYVRGSLPYPAPMACFAGCEPLSAPALAPPGCACQIAGLWVNDNDFTGTKYFSGIDEPTRAQLIADRILATDQDVVVLTGVFSDAAKGVFESALAGNGPYKHYVKKMAGVPPKSDAKLGDIVLDDASLGWVNDLPLFFPDLNIEALDSGLMLFSKYLFLPIPGGVPHDTVCGSTQCQLEGWNNGASLATAHVGFKVFDYASGFDAVASKGVGLVKIQSPGGPSYVAFTQTQSGAGADVRLAQFDQIRDVILSGVPLGEMQTDRAVFVAGDLNVAGFQRTKSGVEEWHGIHQPGVATTATEFFACGNGVKVNGITQSCRYGATGPRAFTDSWGFETSTTDEGSDGHRDDYLLHSARNGVVCMQHAMIAWDLQADPDGNGGKHWLTDHTPVRADFNGTTQWCSANDDPAAALGTTKNAKELVFGPTNCDDSPSPLNPACHQNEIVPPPAGRIRWGGSFQWFVIRQAGTYSMDLDPAVSGQNVQYMVYHHTDLSRPIAAFDPAEGEWGVIWSLPHPPYYIRTFAVDGQGRPDRTAANRYYTLKVHQHLCRTPADGCVLEPGTAQVASPGPIGKVDPLGAYVWPTTGLNDPLSDVKELWWRFKTSGVRDGQPSPSKEALLPTVRIFLEADNAKAYGCLTATDPVLEVYANPLFGGGLQKILQFTAVEVDQDKDWDDDARLPDDRHLAPDLPGDTQGQLKIYFVKLTRSTNAASNTNVCNASMISSLSYHTNLTYFAPLYANATGELDDGAWADDNLCIHTGFDAPGYTHCPPSAVEVTFDVPILQSLEYPALQGYYVQLAWPNFYEMDEHEFLYVWTGGEPFPGFGTLDEWVETNDQEYYHADDTPTEGDYTYDVFYRRCHLATHPACTNLPSVP